MTLTQPPKPASPQPGTPTRAQYTQQNSDQTLREAIAEYYARNPGLLDPEGMPDRARELFRRHDAGHVVFGCDTSLRGETLIDSWTIFATSAGLRGYLEYFNYPQVNQIFQQTGYLRIAMESVRALPAVARLVWRSRRLKARWPWAEYERHLDRPLREIRDDYGITVL